MPDASHSLSCPDWESELIAMATDPDIQREMRRIEAEFMETEIDIPRNKNSGKNSTRCSVIPIQAGTTFMGAKLFHGISNGHKAGDER